MFKTFVYSIYCRLRCCCCRLCAVRRHKWGRHHVPAACCTAAASCLHFINILSLAVERTITRLAPYGPSSLACLYKLHRWNIFTIFALCARVCLFGDFFPVRWTSFAFLSVFHYFAFYVFAEHSMRDEKRNRINFRTHAYTKFMFMKLSQNNAREIKQSDNFDADMRINIK